jgi:hypothetical protein
MPNQSEGAKPRDTPPSHLKRFVGATKKSSPTRTSIPEVTNAALGVKYDLSRETIRLILDRDRRRIERNKRMEAKAHHLGFRGH